MTDPFHRPEEVGGRDSRGDTDLDHVVRTKEAHERVQLKWGVDLDVPAPASLNVHSVEMAEERPFPLGLGEDGLGPGQRHAGERGDPVGVGLLFDLHEEGSYPSSSRTFPIHSLAVSILGRTARIRVYASSSGSFSAR